MTPERLAEIEYCCCYPAAEPVIAELVAEVRRLQVAREFLEQWDEGMVKEFGDVNRVRLVYAERDGALAEVKRLQAMIKDIQDPMTESGPFKPCPPSWKPEHWYGHIERCRFMSLMGLGHFSKTDPKWLVEQYRKHVKECKQPQCSCQFPVGTDLRTGKVE